MLDHEALTLSIADTSIAENAGAKATEATETTVTRSNTDNSAALAVTLTNGDDTEIGIPASVTIPANQASVSFDITVVDDAVVDGTQPVTITASATGYEDGSDTLEVTDFEELTVSIVADSISEKGGSTEATVTRTDSEGTSVVTLVSSDTSEASVDSPITISNGQTTSEPFTITAVDDDEDGTQTVTITASAHGYVVDGSDTVEVTDSEDKDSDGIDDEVERSGPNDGDGNNDGTKDADQDNCATFPNSGDDTYVTLTTPPGTALNNVDSIANPSPADGPQQVDFPVGFFGYSVGGIETGGAVTVEILVHAGKAVNTYYAFGRTPGDPTDHWYPFMYDGQTGAVIYPDRIEVHYVDGQRGDADLEANGEIRDPAGPGVTDHPWQNPASPEDADNDGVIKPLDVLVLINDLNAKGNRRLPDGAQGSDQWPPYLYLDVSGDNVVAPLDVLIVINLLNDLAKQAGQSEPEAADGVVGAIAEGESTGIDATALAWLLQAQRDVSNVQAASTSYTRSVVSVPTRRNGTEFDRVFHAVRRASADSDGGGPQRVQVNRSDGWQADFGLDELELILAEIASDVTSQWASLE